jgi:Protein of unknown function (DUF2970)
LSQNHPLSSLQEQPVADRSILQIISSVLAAFIGVQSEKNRQHDFEKGSVTAFIVAGLVFTVLFVSAIIFVVSKVIGN